ncbi:MAG: transporter ATP-binding protein [Mycobacterium sp.]|nr:transporter ATP-binding protein [Mycobacterium sp.]
MSVDLSAPGASITLNGLTKRYGGVTAVDSIDLNTRPGEFMTLLGPSGSGKTTTLNMIAGFESVTEGDLLINEQSVQSLPPYKRNIGMVFQHYALFPHMSVAENVAYPLRQRRVQKASRERLVETALTTVGLEDLGHRMPRQLSGGQQQRVALARAMVYGPQVLLMDEPLGALDKKLRDSLQLEIKRIHAELGTTFVYVTHDQDEALVLSDRIAVFNEGRIEQVATAHELYERPLSVFVAQFLGESSIFRGVAIEGTGGLGIEVGGRIVLAGRGDVSAGDDAAMIVRPERITVVGIAEPLPDGNILRGRVRQEIYLGSSRKLDVDLAGGGEALVREPAGSVSACGTGDEIWLTFRADDAALLPASAKPQKSNTKASAASALSSSAS